LRKTVDEPEDIVFVFCVGERDLPRDLSIAEGEAHEVEDGDRVLRTSGNLSSDARCCRAAIFAGGNCNNRFFISY
jgi:hypothetical protein